MTLVASVAPLAIYAALFQTIVYFVLPRRHWARWAPVVTGIVGASVVLMAGSIFGLRKIGLGAAEPGEVVGWALLAISIVSLVGMTMISSPTWRHRLADPRLALLSAREAAFQIFVRIPVMTALIEEAVFRGVLHAALLALYPAPAALWLGAGLFGVWHIGPGFDQAGNLESGSRFGAVHVTVTIVATTVAGAGLVWLRMATGSIWAGVAVHAAINMTMAVFARKAATRRATTTISA